MILNVWNSTQEAGNSFVMASVLISSYVLESNTNQSCRYGPGKHEQHEKVCFDRWSGKARLPFSEHHTSKKKKPVFHTYNNSAEEDISNL